MNLRDKLKIKKTVGTSLLGQRLSNKEKSPLDLRELLSSIVKEELAKLIDPIIEQVVDEIRPKKGKDYVDGRHGMNGAKGEKGDSIVGPKGAKGDKPKVGIDFPYPKDGKDGKDGSPDTAEQVVEKVNKAKGVMIASVENLAEELANLKKRATTVSVKGGGMGNPQHEQFDGNGVTVAFTLAYNVAARGTAVFGCRYQGQTLYLGDQYTISGKTLTLVGFIPEDGTKIEITYIRS